MPSVFSGRAAACRTSLTECTAFLQVTDGRFGQACICEHRFSVLAERGWIESVGRTEPFPDDGREDRLEWYPVRIFWEGELRQ